MIEKSNKGLKHIVVSKLDHDKLMQLKYKKNFKNISELIHDMIIKYKEE